MTVFKQLSTGLLVGLILVFATSCEREYEYEPDDRLGIIPEHTKLQQ